MRREDARLRALSRAHRVKLRIKDTEHKIDFFIFRSTKSMRHAIRNFFDNKDDALFHADGTVGLTIFRYFKKQLYCYVFISAQRADVETIAHEASHVVEYCYSEILHKPLNFSNKRANEDFAQKLGKLSQDMFNSVDRFKKHYKMD